MFPGVLGMLGNPVTFASRWGLPLSKSYRDFKAKQLTAQKRRWAKAGNGEHSPGRRRSIRKLTFGEFETRLASYITSHLETEKHACVWKHVRARIAEVNGLGSKSIARVRSALLDLELTLEPDERFAFNRAESEAITQYLGSGL